MTKEMKKQDMEIQENSRIDALFERISVLIEQARMYVANSVNVAEVKTRFEVGRYIFEDEQQGERAAYGQRILKNLSVRLMERYGNDWTYDTLKRCRYFYQAYENAVIGATALPQLEKSDEHAVNEENMNWGNGVATIRLPRFTLSWSHYLILMRIENIEARSFYEIECARQHWSVKQLSRQTGSSLYERLALSRNKDEVMRLATEGQTIGILLCERKNDALVELTLPKEANIYAQQYALCLPDKALLQRKLREWIAEFKGKEELR